MEEVFTSLCYDHRQVRSTPVPGPECSILSNDFERTSINTGYRCDRWQPYYFVPHGTTAVDFEVFDVCFGRGRVKRGINKLLSMSFNGPNLESPLKSFV